MDVNGELCTLLFGVELKSIRLKGVGPEMRVARRLCKSAGWPFT